MKRSELGDLTCSLAAALAEVGDAWCLLIIKEVMLRNGRFDGIAAQTGMSASSLAGRLKGLERAGILIRRAYQTRPTRHEYVLTKKGQGLWPVLQALTTWGDNWSGRSEPPLTYGCKCCGERDAQPKLVCTGCGSDMNARTATAVQSSAMQLARSARER